MLICYSRIPRSAAAGFAIQLFEAWGLPNAVFEDARMTPKSAWLLAPTRAPDVQMELWSLEVVCKENVCVRDRAKLTSPLLMPAFANTMSRNLCKRGSLPPLLNICGGHWGEAVNGGGCVL